MSEIREIALTANQDGRLELVATTDDPAGFGGEVWHAWQTAPNGTWTGWHSFGRPGGGAAGPAVGRNADGRLEVAVVGGDQGVWHRWQTAPNNGWSPWANLGSVATGTIQGPTLASNADGRLELFLRAPDTGGLYQLSQSAPNDGWTPGHGWPPP
jgi:hypothetical protein